MFGQGHIVTCCVIGSLCLLPLAALAGEDVPAHRVSVDEVIQRMLEMDKWRRTALRQYTATRIYTAENKRFSKRAEVSVRESYAYPGKKELVIVSESGSGYVRRKVIDKLIEAEVDAGRDADRGQTQITPENYRFRLIGVESNDGRPCFVVEVTPKQAKKYLMRGKIWVDQQDFGITRMEGSPAKTPSFWTRKVRIARRYQKYGPFWLPVSTESESEIVIAGRSSLRIDYTHYEIKAPDKNAAAPGCCL